MKSPKKVTRKKRVKKVTNSTIKKHRAIESSNASKPKSIKNDLSETDHLGKDKSSKSDQAKIGENVKSDSFRNDDADTNSSNYGKTQPIYTINYRNKFK